MTHERNRTVSRFLHNGENYLIHERSSRLSSGQMYTRRFIVNGDGDWQGEASTVKEARKLLDSQATARKAGRWCRMKTHAQIAAEAREPYARLVSELVGALKELVEIGEGGVIERRETGKPTWYALEAVASIARAALAKAEGR